MSRYALACLLAITIATPVSASPAAAENYDGASGSLGMGCNPSNNIKADDQNHRIKFTSLGAKLTTALNDALDDSYRPTVLTIILNNASDVEIFDANYVIYCGYDWDLIFNMDGLARCMELNSSNECNVFNVFFDAPDVEAMDDPLHRQALACHELGHTVGLVHSNAQVAEPSPRGDTRRKTCMWAGGPGSKLHLLRQGPLPNISRHDWDHINNNYD